MNAFYYELEFFWETSGHRAAILHSRANDIFKQSLNKMLYVFIAQGTVEPSVWHGPTLT